MMTLSAWEVMQIENWNSSQHKDHTLMKFWLLTNWLLSQVYLLMWKLNMMVTPEHWCPSHIVPSLSVFPLEKPSNTHYTLWQTRESGKTDRHTHRRDRFIPSTADTAGKNIAIDDTLQCITKMEQCFIFVAELKFCKSVGAFSNKIFPVFSISYSRSVSQVNKLIN